MGAAARTLSAFEVAVRRRGRALAGGERVGVHAEAHRAAGTAPLGTGSGEDGVETLGLGLRLDGHGAGDDEHPDAVGNGPAAEDVGDDAEILDPAVRAGTDEDRVDGYLAEGGAGTQIHVLERV